MGNHAHALLVSQSELSRLLNVSQPRLIKAVKAGHVVPDFVAGRNILFSPSRIPEIKKQLEGK